MQNSIFTKLCEWPARKRSRLDAYCFRDKLEIFFGLCRARTSRQILTIYMSYDMFLQKDVPFGSCVNSSPHFWGQIPKNHSEV